MDAWEVFRSCSKKLIFQAAGVETERIMKL